MKIEYKIRPVTRFVVTRFHEDPIDKTGSCATQGEFDSLKMAYSVAFALAQNDRQAMQNRQDGGEVIFPNTEVSQEERHFYFMGNGISEPLTG